MVKASNRTKGCMIRKYNPLIIGNIERMIWILCKSLLKQNELIQHWPVVTGKRDVLVQSREAYITVAQNNTQVLIHVVQKKKTMLYVHCEICHASLEGQRARRFPTLANACCVLFVSGFPMFILTGKKWGPGLLCGPCEACQAFQNLDPDYSKQSMDDMT